MPVTLNIGSQNIKLLAGSGKRIIQWATVPVASGLIQNGSILKPDAVAEAVNTLFHSTGVSRADVSAVITGLTFAYRIINLPQMKPSLLREAVERAARKEIPLPLEEIYLDWQIIRETGDETQVLVAGAPRNMVDSLVQTMSLAKVKLKALDLKPLALSRSVNQPNALLVDFEPECFDIVIVDAGIPLMMHAVTPKSESASLEDNVRLLIDELTRTIDFYNITHRKTQILSGTPLLLTGALSTEPTVRELIEKNTGHPIQLPVSPIKVPSDFPVRSYSSNIGLIIKNRTPVFSKCNTINLDFLRARRRTLARPIPVKQTLLPIAAVAALIIMLPLVNIRNQAAAQTTALQAQLDSNTRDLHLARLASEEAVSINTNIKNLIAETDKLRQERDSISGTGNLAANLKVLTGNLPAKADYSEIVSNPNQIVIVGQASSESDVISYAMSLEKSRKFSDVRITLIDDNVDSDAGNTTTTFKITVTR